VYQLDYSKPYPETPLINRKGKHRVLLAHCAALKPGESFEAESHKPEVRDIEIRAMHWFKRKHGLSLVIRQWEDKKIRVWCI
jgi:hypothetical protein